MTDPMKMMNEFFRNRSKRTLLDSIDNAFAKPAPVRFYTEIIENEKHVKIIAELPGVPKGDIHVEIRGDEVFIDVKRQEHLPRKIGGVHRVPLTNDVIKQTMKAVYKQGMLTITIDKKKPTRIEIE